VESEVIPVWERRVAGWIARRVWLRDRRGGPWPAPEDVPSEPVRFQGNTGARLVGRYFHHEDPHGVVVCVHPDRRYGGHWFVKTGWVHALHEAGFDVLTFDLTGYGQGIEVVGTAMDPYIAREKIVQLQPDVITLDVEMPRMDGLSFLARLMKHHPIPTVVVSSVTPKNSEAAMRALALGAVEVIAKPGSAMSIPDVSRQLVRAVRAAAVSRVRAVAPVSAGPVVAQGLSGIETTHRIIAIGASTGGTTAIERVLSRFPATAPGTVMVQHMPPGFTTSFAARLNQCCAVEVREARDGDRVAQGVALLAPGGFHMVVEQSGSHRVVRIRNGPQVHYQRPAVDVLFQSLARSAGRNVTAAVLTGMGADGAAGLLQLREAGAFTIAQDEASCVVFGMPREAIRLDAAARVLDLDDIAAALLAGAGTAASV
jgi:two-component system, chemotaxis family, protein-glutamate methylesterase/glutaminase